MSIETMINNVIQKYGFEHELTIAFCEICEDVEKNENGFDIVKEVYEILM